MENQAVANAVAANANLIRTYHFNMFTTQETDESITDPGMTVAEAQRLHDSLVQRRIVRMQTDGREWWVEYAERFSAKWKRID